VAKDDRSTKGGKELKKKSELIGLIDSLRNGELGDAEKEEIYNNICDQIISLESKVKELTDLQELINEAGRVTFANDLESEYPLSVWADNILGLTGHPMTWGASLELNDERGGRVQPEMISHALKRLREEKINFP